MEASSALGLEETTAYLFHSYGTNLRFEPDEFNFVKERKKSGTSEAFKKRDEHLRSRGRRSDDHRDDTVLRHVTAPSGQGSRHRGQPWHRPRHRRTADRAGDALRDRLSGERRRSQGDPGAGRRHRGSRTGTRSRRPGRRPGRLVDRGRSTALGGLGGLVTTAVPIVAGRTLTSPAKSTTASSTSRCGDCGRPSARPFPNSRRSADRWSR